MCGKTEGESSGAGDFVILPGLCAVLAPLTAIGNKAGAHVWFLLLLYYDFFFSCILQCFIIFCGAEICSDQRGLSRSRLAARSERASVRKFCSAVDAAFPFLLVYCRLRPRWYIWESGKW